VILSSDNRTYRIVSKYKGDLQMKTSLRFTTGALLALTMQAVCFAQHYTQTNLVSNTSGVLAPLDFGRFSHDLLIGQFAGGGDTESSGFIAAYDLATGKFDGLLEDASGKPLAINGIWALSPGNVSPANNDAAAAPATEVFFTAGPNHGSGGLFGYLTAVSTELTEGNSQ
jgi:hypothetical protein